MYAYNSRWFDFINVIFYNFWKDLMTRDSYDQSQSCFTFMAFIFYIYIYVRGLSPINKSCFLLLHKYLINNSLWHLTHYMYIQINLKYFIWQVKLCTLSDVFKCKYPKQVPTHRIQKTTPIHNIISSILYLMLHNILITATL